MATQGGGCERLYIHAGLHKTATTYVQMVLDRNPTALAEHGAFYPRSGRYIHGHHHIAWDVVGDPCFDPAAGGLARLVEELRAAAAPAAIVSSEEFDRLDAAQCRALAEATAEFDPTVVLVIRNPVDLLHSMYAEQAKRFMARRFDDWLPAALEDPVYDHAGLYARWRKAFGAERVRLACFEELTPDPATAVLRLCDLDVAANAGAWTYPEGSEGRNPTLGARTLETNRQLCQRAAAARMPPRQYLELVAPAVAAFGDKAGWNARPPFYMDTATIQAVLARFAESNRWLEEALGRRLPALYFDYPPRERTSPAAQAADREELMELLLFALRLQDSLRE